MCDALETRPQSSGTVQVPQPFTEFFDDAIEVSPTFPNICYTIINQFYTKTNYFFSFSREIPKCPQAFAVATLPLGVRCKYPFFKR